MLRTACDHREVHRQSQLAREQSNLRATTERLSQVLATSPVVLYTLCLGAQHAACNLGQPECREPDWLPARGGA